MNDWFSMTIEDKPRVIGNTGQICARDLVLVEKFIVLNKDILLEYWKQETPVDAVDTFQRFKKV